MPNVGVWLIGAQGSLASTVVLGARAIARKLGANGGLVPELPELAGLRPVAPDGLAFGGWGPAPTGPLAHPPAPAPEAPALPQAPAAPRRTRPPGVAGRG